MTTTVDFENAFKHSQEIIGLDRLKEMSEERQLKFYWGTAPTGRPHLAYFFPLLSIARMIKEGMSCTILFADRHAALDNNKTEWGQLDARAEYYTVVITKILEIAGADISKIRFVRGSSFQRTPAYFDDLLRLSTKVTTKDALKATVEVVKSTKNPPLSNLIYPLMQVLDEIHLGTDFEYGGIDQRNIFMLGIERLKHIGHTAPRNYVMNPLIPGIAKGGKMSSSDPKSKIDFMDDDETIMSKSKKAWSVDKIAKDNGVMSIFKYVLFEFNDRIEIERPDKYGGNVSFDSYEELEVEFEAGTISSVDIKETMGVLLCKLIAPIRTLIEEEHSDLLRLAYGEL